MYMPIGGIYADFHSLWIVLKVEVTVVSYSMKCVHALHGKCTVAAKGFVSIRHHYKVI